MKKEIKKELQELNSTLADHDLKSKFEVPSNYFNNLQLELIQKLEIKNEDNISRKRKSFWEQFNLPIFRPLIAVAGIAILAFGLFFWLQPNGTDDSLSFQDLSAQEIDNYIESNIEEFEMDLISSVSSLNDNVFLDDEYIDEYLDENIEDFDDQLLDDLF